MRLGNWKGQVFSVIIHDLSKMINYLCSIILFYIDQKAISAVLLKKLNFLSLLINRIGYKNWFLLFCDIELSHDI